MVEFVDSQGRHVRLPDPLSREERVKLKGTGIVYVAERDPEDAPPRFTAYWQSERDGRPIFVEQAPYYLDDPDEAVAWGRERAPRVIVRLGSGFEDTRFYTAGEITVEGTDDEPVLSWPPDSGEPHD